ncbi:MAG: hypothetical protein IJQ10_03695 [Clostridia bacterium]|nr:hypothetical protein [Clostridia bacterium]
MFAKKFCAASLSFLALSFNCAPKTNAAVSCIGVFNIIAGSLASAAGLTGIVLGSTPSGTTDPYGLRALIPFGGTLLVAGIANILNGVTANNTKQNTLDIKKLNERLEKLENKSVG